MAREDDQKTKKNKINELEDPQLELWGVCGGGGLRKECVEKDPHQAHLQDSTAIQQNVTITPDVTSNHITYNSPQALVGLTEKVLTS